MRKLMLSAFLALSFIAKAQVDCDEYTKWVIAGDSALAVEDASLAFHCYRTAQIEGVLCGLDSTNQADKGLLSAEKSMKHVQAKSAAYSKWIDSTIAANQPFSNFESESSFTEAGAGVPQGQNDTTATGRGRSEGKVADHRNQKPGVLSDIHTQEVGYRSMYERSKRLLDSVTTVYRKAHQTGNHLPGELAPMQSLMSRLENDKVHNIVARRLFDSTKAEIRKRSVNKLDDFVVYTHLRAVLYYTWGLVTAKQFDPAKQALDDAESLVRKIRQESPLVTSGMADIQNGYFKYYLAQNDSANSFEHIKKAIFFGGLALQQDPYNPFYLMRIAVFFQNAALFHEPILHSGDSALFTGLACNFVAQCNTAFPNTDLPLEELSRCAVSYANQLLYSAKGDEAAAVLQRGLNPIDTFLQGHPQNEKVRLIKIDLLTQLTGIFIDSLTDFAAARSNLKLLYNNWDMLKLRTLEKSDVTLLSKANRSFASLMSLARTKADTADVGLIAGQAIGTLDRFQVLAGANSFSEETSDLVRPYPEKLACDIQIESRADADHDFEFISNKCLPLYLKYRFDFYLGQSVIKGFRIYGAYLMRRGELKQALPLMKFAAMEGVKACSDSVVQIYKQPGFRNSDSMRFYSRLSGVQRSGMKRFTVPATFPDGTYQYYFYVLDRSPQFPYKGIRDQAEWVKRARGGVVAEAVLKSFDKLQAIARDNDVSYQDLCEYALKTASDATNVNLTREKLARLTFDSLTTLMRRYAEKKDTAKEELISTEINLRNNLAQKQGLEYRVQLDSVSFGMVLSDSLKKIVARNYNALAWFTMLCRDTTNVEYYLNKSIQLNPESPYAKGNLPHIYLMTGRTTEAKRLYSELKDRPFDPGNNLPTYRDAFLSDFRDFSRAGIAETDFAEIIQMLN